jgi:hypothetical protein
VQSEAKLPFAALHQLLRPILGRIDSLPDPQKAAILTAFGMEHGAAPSLFLVGLATLTLLGEAATHAPLVVVAEDAHWFDPPSGEVLAFAARRLGADLILLLAAIRDGIEAPLLAARLPETHLEPLDADASMQLLEAHAPGLSVTARDRLRLEAANPLALAELPRALASHTHAAGELLPAILPLTDRLHRAFATRAATTSSPTRWRSRPSKSSCPPAEQSASSPRARPRGHGAWRRQVR